MDKQQIVKELSDDLDLIGSSIPHNLYTQICLCYAVRDDSRHATIISTLTRGLQGLSESFPWIAGQVVQESTGDGSPVVVKITPLDQIPQLVVKDLRGDPAAPTMKGLQDANFPFTMLDELVICPRKTLPGSPDEALDPARIFIVGAYFITGGLLLSFVGQHNAMDMTGQAQIMSLLSKACRNEPFATAEILSGNLPRRGLVPLLDETANLTTELAHQIVRPPSQGPQESTEGQTETDSNSVTVPSTPPPCTWTYFAFSALAQSELKSLAKKTLSSGYVSTDDVVSAFIWQSVLRARQCRLRPTQKCSFARAVDVRRHLGISPTYAGLMQNMTYHSYMLQDLLTNPLGDIAADMRAAVDPKTSTLAHSTRALATLLHMKPSDMAISVTAALDLSSDIALSSWAKIDSYDLDFGLGLGKPESVRRPRFTPVESLFYLMPRRADGEMAVAFCIRNDDLERLRSDAQFAKYATYIG